MNSNSSIKVERLSVELNDEQLKDVSGGLYLPPVPIPKPVRDFAAGWVRDRINDFSRPRVK